MSGWRAFGISLAFVVAITGYSWGQESPVVLPPAETPTIVPVLETPTVTPVPESPTPVPPVETPTPRPETPTVVPETPTATVTPTPRPETPTVVPETPTAAPETPTVRPETPTPVVETPTPTPRPTRPPVTPVPILKPLEMEVRAFLRDQLLAVNPTTLLLKPADTLTLQVTVTDPDLGDIRLSAFVRVPGQAPQDIEVTHEVVERAPGRLVVKAVLQIDVERLLYTPILTITATSEHPRGLKRKTHRIKIVIPKRTPGEVRADINNDGRVSGEDLDRLNETWRGTERQDDPDPADTNGDGVVDYRDLFQIARNWRQAGAAETPTATPMVESPTAVPETPTPVPESPTPVPESPTPVPESPIIVPETSGAKPSAFR